jgi:hypothetical protein
MAGWRKYQKRLRRRMPGEENEAISHNVGVMLLNAENNESGTKKSVADGGIVAKTSAAAGGAAASKPRQRHSCWQSMAHGAHARKIWLSAWRNINQQRLSRLFSICCFNKQRQRRSISAMK